MRTHNAPAVVCLAVCFLLLAGCSSSSYSPNQPITVAVSPQPAYVGSALTVQLSATVTGDTSGVSWSVGGSGGGTVDAQGNYTAPIVTQNITATVTATSIKDPTKSASTTVNIIAPAAVTTTTNAQVAQYSIAVPDGLSVFIQFSTDTSYNLMTSAVPAPSGGGNVPILVAGMKGNTQYHMRAIFQPTGTTTTVFTDADHTFTTSAYPAASLPTLTTTTTSGQTPQPGVELLDLVRIGTPTGQFSVAVSDLSGNILWAYNPGSSITAGVLPNPIKLLPNGHFLIVFSGVNPDGANSVTQEVDLTGQVVWQMTSAQLNTALAAATCAGCNITVVGTHHDFAVIPNGHIVFLASTIQSITLPGDTTPTDVVGDVLIDLDQNHNPVWIWNSFDGQLDVNRHPMSFPDWLHSNSVVYSPDDKALMLSMRHQDWVIKINYNDGAGDGHIMWKLGYQGDFVLQSGAFNSADPVDWFWAQHDANVVSTTTAGTLDVLLFDNGNQRVLQSSPLKLCGGPNPPCESRVPILHLDETAKTADITWIDKLAPVFSFFGGSARMLKNGNVEFDECAATPLPANNAAIFEVTNTTPPQAVWQMQVAGQFAYRGFRIPSLYPGVQW
jgi:arylsulfate sulfotransferase